MSSPLLECVINVSEGRDPVFISELTQLVERQADVKLLHIDPGFDAHRTVCTFVGKPASVVDAAFVLTAFCQDRIDMRKHTGSHPRIGAVDVCPLVPVRDISLKEAARFATQLGARVGQELGLPVYLYEAAATAPHRRNLADIRRGEYEGLVEKMRRPEWRPDFGPGKPVPEFGAVVIGARPFLIAYNISLHADAPLTLAKELAGILRESGRKGQAGIFPGLKALGWYQASFGCCQVSTNVVDPERVNLGALYRTCSELAVTAGYDTAGSELIGLIPERYLVAAGKYFAPAQLGERAMRTAVDRLGLATLGHFSLDQRVLERLL